MTGSAHVLVLRPLIERLRDQGHEVTVTSREYAQTQELLALHGIEHTPIGAHGGASRVRKLVRLIQRTTMMRSFARGRGFDLALAHGSNDLAIASRSLGIPEANMHDYEFAVMQHHVGCRLARRVIFPESVPPERLRRFGVGPDRLRQYPGLKEEYYLADFEPDPGVPQSLGVDPARITVVLRPPPDVSLYHRKSNPLFPEVLMRLGRDEGVDAVVLPRTAEQRRFVKTLRLPSVIVPETAVDAQSLISYSDLVISAGGTMNREAVALGVPVYTTYGGRMGGVDEALIRQGKLRPLTNPTALELAKRDLSVDRTRRDPQLLVELVLGAVRSDRDPPNPPDR
jgi:predicted glycosyltransferase